MFYIYMESFCRRLPQYTVHQRSFQSMFQIYFCFSVIIQNTNMCICSIINERPTTFWLMQRFEVTVIKKIMFCLKHVPFKSDWTWPFVYFIIHFSKDNSGTPFFSLYVKYWCQNHKISHTWGIFHLIHILSFTLIGGRCLLNSCLFMYSTIIGIELITESFKHDLFTPTTGWSARQTPPGSRALSAPW